MDKCKQEDSVVNSFSKNEDNEGEAKELTSTPLKKYVAMVGDKNANKWICNFGCKLEPYTGTYHRIRAHLIGLLPGQKAQGVAFCPKVTEEEREKMRREEEEAQRIFGFKRRILPVPGIPTSPQVNKSASTISTDKAREITDAYKISSKDEADEAIARFFYGNGIPINAAKSPFWIDMVRAINEAARGYEPPSSEKIKTALLDKERTKVDQALISLKQQWPTYGVSIVLNGWENIKKESFVKVMAVSEGRAMLITGTDCSREDFSSEFVAELLLKAIESVGAYSVVQVLTSNTATCKAAGKIIETAYPHIFWSGCIAHALSLLLKDIIKSTCQSLAFIVKSYNQAKGVMKYIKNHSSSLYIVQTFCQLDVLQVKKRQYGNHFVVLERILRVKNALINLVLSEDWEKLSKGRSNSSMGHEDVRKAVLDDDFWKTLKIVLAFIRPIWDVIRCCDSDKACIGEVYQRIDDMLGCIKVALPNGDALHQEVQNLIAPRWEKMDAPLFSLAYVLNPYYYSDNWLTSLAPGGNKRTKPHTNPDVHEIYLDVVDRLVRDAKEASIVRQQLSDFISNRGFCARPQAIKDRETMSALSWWHLYGVSAPELYNLAVKVLSQSVNVTCMRRAFTTYDYICSVKKNKMNASRADCLLYVHDNHRLLTRHREDYQCLYRNWDEYMNDDNLEIDMEAIEQREYTSLYGNEIDAAEAMLTFDTAETLHFSSSTPILSSQTSFQGSSSFQEVGNVHGKKARLG